MPKLIEMHRRLKDQGLVLIGIHTTNGGERMAKYAEEAGVNFPIAIDIDKKTTSAFRVDSYPDYYLIDRSGKLRVADLANADLERAVKVLLAEKPAGADTDKERKQDAPKKRTSAGKGKPKTGG